MMKSSFPMIACFLTDAGGTILNPYKPGSIRYSALTSPKGPIRLPSDEAALCNSVSVAIQGFVAVCADGKNLSAPIPFCIIQQIPIRAPKGSVLNFRVNRFRCCAVPVLSPEKQPTNQIRISIQIETTADSKTATTLAVPEADKACRIKNTVCILADRIYDSVPFKSETCVIYTRARLTADVSHYNAISDGAKKVYTDEDELKEYGSTGILSPGEVSYYNLYVNGVLQPRTGYRVKKGCLELLTENAPLKGQLIILVFVTFMDSNGCRMDVADNLYNAAACGIKKIYTDADALKSCGSKGIPSPNSVSYFNLYINGILQPQTTYNVKKGILELTACGLPKDGSLITLESVVIKDTLGQLFRSDTYEYNALSNGTRIYTDCDELFLYGKKGILDPRCSAYQNLFINGVIQPETNYTVQKGCLILNTEDTPTAGIPISLQYVNDHSEYTWGEYGISDRAYCKWADHCSGFKAFDSTSSSSYKTKSG